LRDEGNYVGPTINRTGRLRDLAHGGQTVLSGATESMVLDHLPADAWLTDLGTHALRDLPRPERVVQLCHPDIRNEFPPLRIPKNLASRNLPSQLTRFVGRGSEIALLRETIAENRLVTLTGAGGAGKTRLAVEVAGTLASEFPNGVWYVDLAPITNPAVVPVTTARTLGLPDQPGSSTMDILLRFIGDRKMLLLLDNCEHLLDACGQMVNELLNACAALTILTTTREPIGVAGEWTWRVPSLSVSDDAIELFADRARRARPDFTVSDENTGLVSEICRRLDGMPLAIELAAARIRALTLSQILDSLHDRFRLLTGGSRTAVRRQQTLRASVDWSHALLTDPERVLLRRLAVFMGGFDLDAAQAVGGSTDVERYQLLDQISLLVDKSLVVAEDARGAMRYGLLETVRQYALEKLSESGEADEVRARHRDYYTATALHLESTTQPWGERLLKWAAIEIDNLRAAYGWSRERSEFEAALRLVSSLQEFWFRCGRMREGLAGFDAILPDMTDQSDVPPAVWARAIADQGILAGTLAVPFSLELAQEAVAVARRLDDSALVVRTLIACGMSAFYDAALAERVFDEAAELAREKDHLPLLCQIRDMQAIAACFAGDFIAAHEASVEGREIADSIGERYFSVNCQIWLTVALWHLGDLSEAVAELGSLAGHAERAVDPATTIFELVSTCGVLLHRGAIESAQAAAESLQEAAQSMGGIYLETVHGVHASIALAAGDAPAALRASEAAWRHTTPIREIYGRSFIPMAEAALACGELVAARGWADDAVAVVPGSHRGVALLARAFVAIPEGEPEQAERDIHEALAISAETRMYLRLPDTLECLARLAADGGNHQYAARLVGAAKAVRQRVGQVRFRIYDADFEVVYNALRDTLGREDFDALHAEGAALSAEEAIAYAQRGRGERKRPTSGWASLTPTELDVVRLVSEGLGNKDIAARLFVSHRTVQTHLTHVYNKLGMTSRVQLAQEAVRHA
jgi:predicted ATPase/DNA-binding CsgD family transcriptional regulator